MIITSGFVWHMVKATIDPDHSGRKSELQRGTLGQPGRRARRTYRHPI